MIFLSEQGSTYFDERAPEIKSCAFQSGPVTDQDIPCYKTCKAKKLLIRIATEKNPKQYKHNPGRIIFSDPIFREYAKNADTI